MQRRCQKATPEIGPGMNILMKCASLQMQPRADASGGYMGGQTQKVKPPVTCRSIQADEGRYAPSRLPEKEAARLSLPDIMGRRIMVKDALLVTRGRFARAGVQTDWRCTATEAPAESVVSNKFRKALTVSENNGSQLMLL